MFVVHMVYNIINFSIISSPLLQSIHSDLQEMHSHKRSESVADVAHVHYADPNCRSGPHRTSMDETRDISAF